METITKVKKIPLDCPNKACKSALVPSKIHNPGDFWWCLSCKEMFSAKELGAAVKLKLQRREQALKNFGHNKERREFIKESKEYNNPSTNGVPFDEHAGYVS